MENPPSDRTKQQNLHAYFNSPVAPRNLVYQVTPNALSDEQKLRGEGAVLQIASLAGPSPADLNYVSVQKPESRPQRSPVDDRRDRLKAVAKETKELLPGLLGKMPHAPSRGSRVSNPSELGAAYCPNLSTKVQVVNGDSFDIAIALAASSPILGSRDTNPVCVLNMANRRQAGGGWLSGALAQEEELCFRSSLSFTLKLKEYPFGDLDALYSPTVAIFRDSFTKGHKLMDLNHPNLLPVVSVVSVAALYQPKLNRSATPHQYRHSSDREMMKGKMRVILRVAAFKKHRRLVLGALGCGAFCNPNHEVANCWAEVLQENEFKGWWENIVFAVIDDSNGGTNAGGNLAVFRQRLDGLQV